MQPNEREEGFICEEENRFIGLIGNDLQSLFHFQILLSLMSFSYTTLRVEELDDGRIIRASLSRTKALNAMNMPFFTELADLFVKINKLEQVRAVILQADGRMFTAGLDLKEMASLFTPDGEEDPSRVAAKLYFKIKELQQSCLNVYECRVPVITGVHSLCIGGGIDLISATDIRYCTKDSQFSIKEIDIGMAADLGTLQIFPRIVGNQSTFRELAYTGRSMNSQEAVKIGLVSKIFEDKAQLEAGLLETARIIASKSPVGIHTIKQVIKKAQSAIIYEGLEYIARTNSVMLQTKDMMEAIGAFLQKKKPVFPKL